MIGPHGEKRPGNPTANAVHVAKLATGEAEETYVDTAKQKRGKKGGEARAAALSPDERSQIAQVAAAARWNQEDIDPAPDAKRESGRRRLADARASLTPRFRDQPLQFVLSERPNTPDRYTHGGACDTSGDGNPPPDTNSGVVVFDTYW